MSRYSNKIESIGLRKCPYYRYLIEKVTATDARITNISQSLPHKMAENSWYEEITSLSPYVCTGDTDAKNDGPEFRNSNSVIFEMFLIFKKASRGLSAAYLDHYGRGQTRSE